MGFGVLVYRSLLIYTLVVKGGNSFTPLRFCKVIWDPSRWEVLSKCKLVHQHSSWKPKTLKLMLLHCELGEMIFLLTSFQDFNGTLRRDRITLIYRKQLNFDRLSMLLSLKGHKPFLLVIQLELLFGSAVRLLHPVFPFLLAVNLIFPRIGLK